MATDPTQEYHPPTTVEPRNTETVKLETTDANQPNDTKTYGWYPEEEGFPLLVLLLIAMGPFGVGFVFGRCSVGRGH